MRKQPTSAAVSQADQASLEGENKEGIAGGGLKKVISGKDEDAKEKIRK